MIAVGTDFLFFYGFIFIFICNHGKAVPTAAVGTAYADG
jgi:hypothetical protein